MDDAALAEVIRGAQRGDAAAFDRLVDAYGHRITGFLHRMTESRQDAENLAQEVFLRLVRTIGAYKHDGRFEPWIFRIAANLARDRVRRAKRAPKFVTVKTGGTGEAGDTDEFGSLDKIEGSSEPADAAMERGEQIDALHEALATLPEAEREVMMLRHFSQMSFKEIAEMADMPLGTALARAHRGLARLREIMTTRDASGERTRRRSSRTAKPA
jgi:RNA polymerase sigma-70 factor (ECF subfamily)